MNATLGLGRLKILLGSTQTLLAGLQQVTVIAVAAMMVIRGDGLSLGMMFALLSFRQTFSDRMGALVSQLVQIRFIGLHLDRLSDIVIEEREDPPARTSTAFNTALLAPEKFRGSIAFQDVSFSYGVGQEPVLKNITFAVNPGEFIAISAASGSGKTTLLKLLLGLLQPTSGQILLDGFPASPAAWRSFRQAAGVVVQDDRLLSGSVGDNTSFFDAEGTFSRIVDAARKASIHEDIMGLPMQYQTLVGDMGSSLSGGQKQRVLIARALYREPAILILDEGTANLDHANERVISSTVTRMTATRIIVSHRSDLITYVDRMIVVGGGGIEDVRTVHRPDPVLATASI